MGGKGKHHIAICRKPWTAAPWNRARTTGSCRAVSATSGRMWYALWTRSSLETMSPAAGTLPACRRASHTRSIKACGHSLMAGCSSSGSYPGRISARYAAMSSSSLPATFKANTGARALSGPRQPSQRSPSSMGLTAARSRRYDRYKLPVSPRTPTGQSRFSEDSASLAATARSVPWPLPKICRSSAAMRAWMWAGTPSPKRPAANLPILSSSSCSICSLRYIFASVVFFSFFRYASSLSAVAQDS